MSGMLTPNPDQAILDKRMFIMRATIELLSSCQYYTISQAVDDAYALWDEIARREREEGGEG